jgi:hypothetical protein
MLAALAITKPAIGKAELVKYIKYSEEYGQNG